MTDPDLRARLPALPRYWGTLSDTGTGEHLYLRWSDVDALLREPPELAPLEWQPIATAPKDGTWFWVKRDPPRPNSINVSAFRWDASDGQWFAGTGWWPQVERMFTHWLPFSAAAPEEK